MTLVVAVVTAQLWADFQLSLSMIGAEITALMKTSSSPDK